MAMNDNDFEEKLKLLGLQSAPYSEVEETPVYESQVDPTTGMAVPGNQFNSSEIGTELNEKINLEAAPEPLTGGFSAQPLAQLASADPEMSGLEPEMAPAPMPVPAPKMVNPRIAEVVSKPEVQALMAKKMEQAAAPQAPVAPQVDPLVAALADAQQTANNRRLAANIGAGLETIARAPTSINPDNAFYNNLVKGADQGVTDIKDIEKAKSDKITADAAKLKLNNDKENNDPNSATSNAVRTQYSKLFKSLGLEPNALSGMSAEGIKNYAEKIVTAADAREARKFIAEQNNAARAEARKLAAEQKKDDSLDTIDYKEKVKEGATIRKEDRKLREDLEKADNSLESQLKNLREAKDALTKYSGNSLGGTGPLATGFGTKKYISSDLERLQSRLNQISLSEMVKTFQNMSRAVDSDTERKAWEATQPNIQLDDATNKEIIDRAIKATESMISKTKAAKSRYDQAGSFDADTTSPRSPESRGTKKEPGAVPEPSNNSMSRKVMVSNGKETLEIDAADLADAEKDGFQRL